jgi:hypothetical protein
MGAEYAGRGFVIDAEHCWKDAWISSRAGSILTLFLAPAHDP